MSNEIQILNQTGRWRARNVNYWGGRWDQIQKIIPEFKIEDFRMDPSTPVNPYLKTIVRQPVNKAEMPIPVGVVSHSYALAQHAEVAGKCFEGVKSENIQIDNLDCEIGLTDLGEWMNLRVYFPEKYDHTPSDGKKIRLRLECMNSVDGSSRLVILLGWFRFVCSNGLVIGETKKEIRAVHNESLDLEKIPEAIKDAMKLVESDIARLKNWESKTVSGERLKNWVNNPLSKSWGKKASCRVFHICSSGYDVEIVDPFAPGEATEKPIKKIKRVPGAPEKAVNLYDVSQAMSWVATSRNNTEERLEWQSSIPEIIGKFATV
jgi:hypothetical protein